MVDIQDKKVTSRTAVSVGSIKFSNNLSVKLIKENNNKKGDVISVSRIAGIMSVKNTSNIIPLCHQINLNKIKIDFEIDELENQINVECLVKCEGKTGVEMESLMGVQIALLTIYDMCKAVDKGMIISNVRVTSKTGGKSGDFSI